jgi:hypothetical protein
MINYTFETVPLPIILKISKFLGEISDVLIFLFLE